MKKNIVFSVILVLLCLCSCISGTNTNNSLGEVRLHIETYKAGMDQVTHPSVVKFDSAWNGHKYWMAYTPYPFAEGEEENPCIAVSDDLFYWDTPKGMVNPIADNEETGCDELKDAHILYRDDLNRIEVWYLGRLNENLGGDNDTLLLFRKYSYDGITWSDYEIMSETEYLSPSIIWKDGKYQFWGIGYEKFDNTGTVAYFESVDGKNWSNQKNCSIDGVNTNLPVWHGSVTYSIGTYYFVYIESSNDSQQIYCCQSSNGVDYEYNSVVVQNRADSNWKKLYRPFLLIDHENYELFYGVITGNNEWYITKSSGTDIHDLSGITSSDEQRMKPLESHVTDTHSLVYIFKDFIKQLKTGLRVELFLICPLMYLIHFILAKKQVKQYYIFGLYLLVCIVYEILLLKPFSISSAIAYWVAAFMQSIFMYLVIEKLMPKTVCNNIGKNT